MLKFTSIVGYTSCGPTYIGRFLTIFGQCINVLNFKYIYIYIYIYIVEDVRAVAWQQRNKASTTSDSGTPVVEHGKQRWRTVNGTRAIERTKTNWNGEKPHT